MTAKPSYEELEAKVRALNGIVAELARSRRELRQLAAVVREARDAIIVCTLAGRIIEWNKGATKMYGWPEAAALAMTITELAPPDRAEEAQLLLQAIGEGRAVESFESKRLTADGRILEVWLSATALVDGEGKPEAMVTTERDITARKQAEKEKVAMIKQLQKALAEVKTLRGIVPICMFCKQIRDDTGYWQQVEVYVHNHSEADFSHGICPNCLKERYPKLYQKQLLLEKPK